MSVTIQQRGDTAANWTSANPVLHQREIGVETDTGKLKIGDGVTAWTSLAYWTGTGGFANPMTTLGDIIYENAAPLPARLAGPAAGAAPYVLTSTPSGGTAQGPAWSLFLDAAAADIQPPGVAAAGSKGQAADAKHVHPYQPWQFQPEAYGAKGDGALLADGYMTSGQAVLTTQGMAAPAAPVPTTATTGGTILAGTYQVQTTYVNQYGETVASTAGSVTTTGSTSTITIPSVQQSGNATGWKAYVTQPGGSTFTLQGGVNAINTQNTSLVLTAPPTSTGANPPAANTTASNPFTSADAGKSILVWMRGGATWLFTTILSYQSAGQVTLAANATSTVTGVGVAYGTDDTTAIRNCQAAAMTYAQAGNHYAELVFGPKMYCLATAATKGGATLGNAQIPLPVVSPTVGSAVRLAYKGVKAPMPLHWTQPMPLQGGTILLSMRLDGAKDATYGPTAVIGGPFAGYGGDGGLFTNIHFELDGVTIMVPPGGGTPTPYAGLDLYGVSEASIGTYAHMPLGVWEFPDIGYASSTVWPQLQAGLAYPSYTFGLRGPAPGNNALVAIDTYACMYAQHGIVGNSHMSVRYLYTQYCADGIVPGASEHGISILHWDCEQIAYPINDWPSDGYGSGGDMQICVGMLNAGSFTKIVTSQTQGVRGTIYFENASAYNTYYALLTDNQTPGIKLISVNTPPGPMPVPGSGGGALPASGAQYNNYWYRDVEVTLSVSGGTISAHTVGGTAELLPASATWWKFVVPSGWSFTPTFTGTLSMKLMML